jgi:hypothetical protein
LQFLNQEVVHKNELLADEWDYHNRFDIKREILEAELERIELVEKVNRAVHDHVRAKKVVTEAGEASHRPPDKGPEPPSAQARRNPTVKPKSLKKAKATSCSKSSGKKKNKQPRGFRWQLRSGKFSFHASFFRVPYPGRSPTYHGASVKFRWSYTQYNHELNSARGISTNASSTHDPHLPSSSGVGGSVRLFRQG